MEVAISMVTRALMMAEFIVEHTSAILKSMYYVALLKERQYAEYARLVHHRHNALHI